MWSIKAYNTIFSVYIFSCKSLKTTAWNSKKTLGTYITNKNNIEYMKNFYESLKEIKVIQEQNKQKADMWLKEVSMANKQATWKRKYNHSEMPFPSH